MRDGSDAIADWPILNALVNVAAGATWVSVHHGGGVGIGNSIHAGMVVVADGTDDAAERLERVLTADPGTRRHAPRSTPATTRRSTRPRARHGLDLPLPARTRRSASGASSATSRRGAAAHPRSRPARHAGGPRGAAARTRARATSTCSRTRTSSARAVASPASGAWATCRALDGDVDELDGRGLLRDPRPRRLPHAPGFGGDRVEEFALRAAGAGYEELHAAGGGILSTVRATRAAGEDGLREAVRRHRGWMLARRHDDVRGEVGLRARPRDRARVAARRSREAGGIPTWLGAHAVPPEFDDADAYLDFALAEVLPARRHARGGGRRLPRARRLRRRAGAPLPRGLPRGGPRAAAARRPVHGVGGDPARDRARSALGRPPRGDRATDGVRALAQSDVVGVLLPASALFLGRPMPPARALVDAGAAVALATDFNPGSAFCESLPLVCALAATQLRLAPAEALAACTVNAAHVLGRADRKGRLAPGLRRRPRPARRAGLALPRVPPRARPRRPTVVRAGEPVQARLGRVPSKKQTPPPEGAPARVRVRLRRRGGPRGRGRARARGAAAGTARRRQRRARPCAGATGGRTVQPPSWSRVLQARR